MIKSMGKANLHGLMANLITDNDSMANSMELESIPTRNQKTEKENGPKEKEFDGSIHQIQNQFQVSHTTLFLSIDHFLIYCIYYIVLNLLILKSINKLINNYNNNNQNLKFYHKWI